MQFKCQRINPGLRGSRGMDGPPLLYVPAQGELFPSLHHYTSTSKVAKPVISSPSVCFVFHETTSIRPRH